ncbi:hypothetical protein CW713_08555 [Methanophagales archaeon]|nr:MAG: hypothetical protein CW713_08555 [Methanophagales archaeon]
MKKEALVVIILLCLAVGIFSVAPNVSAEEEEFVATVIDTAGSETTVYDLYLYYYKVSGIFMSLSLRRVCGSGKARAF